MSWRHSWPVTGLSTEEPIETTNQPWKSEALNHLLQWCKPEGNAWDSADSRFSDSRRGMLHRHGDRLTAEGDWTKA